MAKKIQKKHKVNSKFIKVGQYATDNARFDNHNELYY